MPEPLYRRGPITLHQADSLDLLARLPADHVEAIVTDSPYHLHFMNRDWDRLESGMWNVEWAAAALRVAAPGARLLAFGGTRTHHRLWCAIEDAGWEIVDTLMWLHGQGFPKARSNLKPAHEPIVLARKRAPHCAPLNIDPCRIGIHGGTTKGGALPPYGRYGMSDGKCEIVPLGKGRWPANLVLTHHPDCRPIGTKRVKGTKPYTHAHDQSIPMTYGDGAGYKAPGRRAVTHADPDGLETVAAWDCVVGHDAAGNPVHASDSPNRKSQITNRQCSCPVHLLDQQSGECASGGGQKSHPTSQRFAGVAFGTPRATRGDGKQWDPDRGPASRFFYTAKAARGERNAGCDHLWWKRNGHGYEPVTHDHWKHLRKRARAHGNIHPTVKPLALMQWLVRLVAPHGGPVLDPFAGSGTTLLACAREGIQAIGIERDPQSCQIAIARLDHALAPQEPAP